MLSSSVYVPLAPLCVATARYCPAASALIVLVEQAEVENTVAPDTSLTSFHVR